MKRTDLPIAAQRLIGRINYATIATITDDGRPWNTPVYGCFDDDLNLYWASWTQNRHSCNIASSPHIFVVLYDSTATEGQGYGLYLQMTARMLTTMADVTRARQTYQTLFGEDGQHEPFSEICPRRLYKATPLAVWDNTDAYLAGGFIDRRRLLSERRQV